jgi:hypothetical protein
MKFALYLFAFVIAALVIPFFIPSSGKTEGVDPNSNLPWQITLDGQGGSTVFGLKPGVSTLGEVRRRFEPELELAIVLLLCFAGFRDGENDCYGRRVK